MLYIGLFLFEMYLLYLLANKVNDFIYIFFKKIFKNTRITVYLMSFVLLPGTFLHEAAHFLTAKILYVPVKSFSLKPTVIKNDIIFGSVLMQKSDPIRSFLIGGAPVIFGLMFMYIAFYFFPIEKALENAWVAVFMIILIFQISNTMFSSRKDMESAIFIIVFLLTSITILFILKDYLPITGLIGFINNPVNTEIIRQISLYLLFPIVINGIFAYFVYILIK